MDSPVLRVGGVPEHFNLPWHLASEQDLFRQANCDVTFTEYGGGTGQLTTALEENELDIAVLLFEGALRKILNGGSYRIVKLYTATPLVWGIHVAATSDIQTVDQVMGKRHAISRYGSGSHLIAIVDASERDWPTDNIEFVKIGNLGGARQSLAAGESDIFFWEKFMTKPLVDSGEFRRIAERVVPWPAFVVAVRDDVLTSHADLVKSVLSIAAESCRQLKQDPAAAQVIAGRYELQLDDAIQWLRQTDWCYDFEFPQNDLETVFGYLKLLNLIDDPNADYRTAWHDLDAFDFD